MNNFYEIVYNMESYDSSVTEGKSYIYADYSNIKDIESTALNNKNFSTMDLLPTEPTPWPEIKFYYNSAEGKRESDWLGNINYWLIIHQRVMMLLEQAEIKGISFYPIHLVDLITNDVSKDYYYVHLHNFINAYDMNKSKFIYNKKYNKYIFDPVNIYLNREICEKYDIFRADKFTPNIYVSEKIKKIIDDNQLTGFRLSKQK